MYDTALPAIQCVPDHLSRESGSVIHHQEEEVRRGRAPGPPASTLWVIASATRA
jgi:hypothetical protein